MSSQIVNPKLPSYITQANHIFVTLHQTSPKCSKRGIIDSLFNILFHDLDTLAEINSIKNNMAILEEN